MFSMSYWMSQMNKTPRELYEAGGIGMTQWIADFLEVDLNEAHEILKTFLKGINSHNASQKYNDQFNDYFGGLLRKKKYKKEFNRLLNE